MATLAQMDTIAEEMYDLNSQGDDTYTMEIVSAPGVGKTSWARAFGKYMAAKFDEPFGVCIRHLSTEDPLDGPGVLHIGEEGDDKVKRALRTYPGLMPQPWEFDGDIPARGILVLDEYGQADNDQKKATATLIDERRLGKYELPKGWMVILTSNRTSDRAGVAKPLTFITNRKTTIEVDYDSEGHSQWLNANGIHPKLAAFPNTNASTVCTNEVPEHDNPYMTPRSFTRAAKALMQFDVVDMIGLEESTSPTARLAREVCAGFVGEGATARLFGHLKYCEHMVTMDEILNNPTKANVPDRPDVCWAVVQMMSQFAQEQSVKGTNVSLVPMFA